MSTDFEGQFHKEIMLCEPNGVLQVQKQITDESKRSTYIKEDKARKVAERLREQRAENKKRTFADSSPEQTMTSLNTPTKSAYNTPTKSAYNTPTKSAYNTPTKSAYNTPTKKLKYTGGKKSRRSTKRFRKTLRKIETKERQK